MLQLPGSVQGLSPLAAAGKMPGAGLEPAQAATGLSEDELREAIRSLRDSEDPAAAEQAAMLETLLAGGMPLPLQGETSGRVLPPFAAISQALTRETAAAGVSPVAGKEILTAGELDLEQLQSEMPEIDLQVALQPETLRKSQFESLINRVELAQPVVSQANPGIAALASASVSMPVSQSTGAMPATSLLAMPVPQPLGDPAWGNAIGERLVWMARGEQQSAELKITPPNLGPLEVRLNINNDQASVSFVSNHAQVRDAIESAIPRLREMLAEHALELVQADVGSERRQGERNPAEPDQGTLSSGGQGSSDSELYAGDSTVNTEARSGSGLLDLFA